MKLLNKKQTSFGRHETFPLRFGWITKGFKALSSDPKIFSDDQATVVLGVGKNMVYAINYWLIASQVVRMDGDTLKPTALGKRIFNIGKGHDPYLEDDATIWLIHWLIASNAKDATSFFWFFNHYHKPEFTHKELLDALRSFVKEKTEGKATESTMKSEINILLRMYEPSISDKATPIEEGLDSPLAMLGLINELTDSKYHESKLDTRWTLPVAVFAYAVIETFEAMQLTVAPVERLMISGSSQAAPGTVFRLNHEGLISKLEEMINWLPGFFELRETAGLNQLYKLKDIDPLEVLDKHYADYSNLRLELVV